MSMPLRCAPNIMTCPEVSNGQTGVKPGIVLDTMLRTAPHSSHPGTGGQGHPRGPSMGNVAFADEEIDEINLSEDEEDEDDEDLDDEDLDDDDEEDDDDDIEPDEQPHE
jgi:hypothetical protein